MLCSVYKSSRKADTYLFINKRDDFSEVPEALLNMFGTPILVTVVNLAAKTKLGMADIKKVKESLNGDGFYLQLPPPQEDLLKTHREQQKTNNNELND